jgi:hypothetical protein
MMPDSHYYLPAKPWPLPGYSYMRASPADREQVIGTLTAAFLDGRLTKEEHDERVGRALVSRTYGDLGRLTEDLPGPPPGHPFPRMRPPVPPPERHRNRVVSAVITLVFALIMAFILSHALHSF